MLNCEEQAFSNDYYDFIVSKQDAAEYPFEEVCIQELDKDYVCVYADSSRRNEQLRIGDYSYSAIPKCFGLLDQVALESSGILRVRDQPNLALTGQGVLIGFVDTDFDFTNPVFCHSDGTTRVERIWNQQERSGIPPQGFLYGTEYTREEINLELLNEDSKPRIPHSNGHGTFLAALAAGSEDFSNKFSGAAPECDLAFVQLKPAKQYLKDFYFIPQQAQVYQENDIMAGIHYLNLLASQLRKPLCICVALGANMGNRDATNPISNTLTTVAERRQRCVVVAAGNEADKRHHFLGSLASANAEERVEISVSTGVDGFIAEFWALSPELYEVTIVSPTGERFHAQPSIPVGHSEYRFLFEGTNLTVDYVLVGTSSRNELIYFRFEKPIAGIWTLLVRARNFYSGRYHIWLPMEGMVSGNVVFLRSNPDTTITIPSNTTMPITVAGYNSKDNSIYFESGRGFTVNNEVKPEIAAPAVDVYGPVSMGQYGTRTGTSVAAAITAGAGALLLEWTGVRRNDISASTVNIKNYFIRGAERDDNSNYPNREWGWGRMDLYQTFENFRNL